MPEAIDEIIDRRTQKIANLILLAKETESMIKQELEELQYFVKKRDDDNQEGYGR